MKNCEYYFFFQLKKSESGEYQAHPSFLWKSYEDAKSDLEYEMKVANTTGGPFPKLYKLNVPVPAEVQNHSLIPNLTSIHAEVKSMEIEQCHEKNTAN